jgi:TolA-binding protein
VYEFEAFMRDITKLGKVTSVHRDSQDVTDEYYDLQAHIGNKQIEEARLKEYMQQKTSRLSDILTLEQELSRVRGEIEEMQGRLRLLDHQASMSTVTITLSEEQAKPAAKAGLGTLAGKAFMSTLGDIGADLAGLAVWFAGTLPYLVVLAACILVARRQWLRTIGKAVN